MHAHTHACTHTNTHIYTHKHTHQVLTGNATQVTAGITHMNMPEQKNPCKFTHKQRRTPAPDRERYASDSWRHTHTTKHAHTYIPQAHHIRKQKRTPAANRERHASASWASFEAFAPFPLSSASGVRLGGACKMQNRWN